VICDFSHSNILIDFNRIRYYEICSRTITIKYLKLVGGLKSSVSNMIEVIVITGRTTEQGVTIEEKLSEDYFKAVSYCELSDEDFEALGLSEGDRVKIKTEFGEVVVFARKSSLEETHLPKGVVFIPMGPYANQVINPLTGGTGTPQFKGVKGTIEKTDEEVKKIHELI